jgi:flagellar biogenesis protein FliO
LEIALCEDVMQEWIQNIFGNTVNPIAAYIIIFMIIVLAIYILVRIARRLLGGTFVAGGKSRHLRLAIMDATPVDSHRRLVLVRRDDVEHLILIGGPTDVVVEQNIKLSTQTSPRQEPAPISTPNPALMAAPMPAAERIEAPVVAAISQPVAAAPAVRQYAPPPIMPRPIQPVTHAPVRPVATVTPRSEPRSVETRPIEPRPMEPRPIAPNTFSQTPIAQRPADVRPVATPSGSVERDFVPLVPKREPVIAASAAVAANAAATHQEPIKPISLEDSLLVDLSNDIDNATNDVDEISLEDEMEGLLASLDTKNDRIG